MTYPIERDKHALDIGCGTGFPLIELAQRLGTQTSITGIDPWESAMQVTRKKLAAYGLEHINLLVSDFLEASLPDQSFDLITSNLGINNFDRPEATFRRCYDLLKPGASLCITTNTKLSFSLFYQMFEKVLDMEGLNCMQYKLRKHIAHRPEPETLIHQIESYGFSCRKRIDDRAIWRFSNGTALLNHSLFVMAFLPDWKSLIPTADQSRVFRRLEVLLNEVAHDSGELQLTVPMVYLHFIKNNKSAD